MAIFGKDYKIVAIVFTGLYMDKYLIHIASCSDEVLRYICFTFPLEHGKGPSLVIDDGQFWDNEEGDEMKYVFKDGDLTYAFEFSVSDKNVPIFHLNLEIIDAQGQITSWKLDDCSDLPLGDWGIFYNQDQPL